MQKQKYAFMKRSVVKKIDVCKSSKIHLATNIYLHLNSSGLICFK